MQPTSLKALANKVLERNRQCNQDATSIEKPCNFDPPKQPQKLHSSCIEEKAALPKIEPMAACLHGKQCPHLDGPGDRRPLCSKADAPVFDLMACPLNKWAKQHPKPKNTTLKRKAEKMTEQDENAPFIVTEPLEIHPMGEIMPWMTDAEMDGMKESINKVGLLDPIVLFQGKIVDGKCRYKACREVGATVWARKWEGGMDPVEYVLSVNMHRQHHPKLTLEQRQNLGQQAEPNA